MNRYNHPTWATRAIFVLVPLAMILWSQNTRAQSIRSKDEVSRIVAIEKVTVKNGTRCRKK
jgi:hypothetical protein